MPARDAKTHRRAKDAVSDYVAHHRADAAGELDFYRAIPTLRRAISKAARAHTTDDGKHPHQQLIPCEVLRSFGARLVRRERTLREAQSFDDLHRVVQRVGDLVPGIGPLAVYDTALRIGARLDLSPTRVYLHRGHPRWRGSPRCRPPTLDRLGLRTAARVRAPRTTRD